MDVPLDHGEVGVAAIKATSHGLGGKLEGVSKVFDGTSGGGPNDIRVLAIGIIQDSLKSRGKVIGAGLDVDRALDLASASGGNLGPEKRTGCAYKRFD